MPPVDYLGFAYAWVLAVGGIVGFLKAGSLPSLMAGIGSGTFAAVGAHKHSQDPRNVQVILITAVFLSFFMGQRFLRTGKFMPAGLLSLLSIAMSVRYGRLYRS